MKTERRLSKDMTLFLLEAEQGSVEWTETHGRASVRWGWSTHARRETIDNAIARLLVVRVVGGDSFLHVGDKLVPSRAGRAALESGTWVAP